MKDISHRQFMDKNEEKMNKPEPTAELLQLIICPQKCWKKQQKPQIGRWNQQFPAMKNFRIDQMYLYALGRAKM